MGKGQWGPQGSRACSSFSAMGAETQWAGGPAPMDTQMRGSGLWRPELLCGQTPCSEPPPLPGAPTPLPIRSPMPLGLRLPGPLASGPPRSQLLGQHGAPFLGLHRRQGPLWELPPGSPEAAMNSRGSRVWLVRGEIPGGRGWREGQRYRMCPQQVNCGRPDQCWAHGQL